MRNKNYEIVSVNGDKNPLSAYDTVMKARDVALMDKAVGTLHAHRGMRHRVAFINKSTGNADYYAEMKLFVMPTGAADITLGTFTTNADGSRTFTPSKEGYLIDTSGALLANTKTMREFSGGLLTDYFDGYNNYDPNSKLNLTVDVLEEGDAFWIVCGGDYNFYSASAVAAIGNHLKAGGTAGQVTESSAVSTATLADFNTTNNENSPGLVRGKTVGTATEVTGAAGLVWGRICVPTVME